MLEQLGHAEAADLTSRYMAFVWYAFNNETWRFRNFMSYQRQWLENSGSDDSHCRALWALGTLLGRSDVPAYLTMAGKLKVNELISRRYTLEQINEGFERLGRGEVARGVIVF